MNRRLVGTLVRESTGAVHFTYDRSWLDWEGAIAVSLSLPLRADRYIGAPVIAVFENLLPDNDSIRQRVAERVGAQGTDAYSMLSKIGRDCVGALQFLPEGEEPSETGNLDGEIVNERQIEEILKDLDVAPLGIRGDHDFRISVAGAQDKTALLYYDGQWMEPSGTTPTTHIIKPQIGRLSNGMDLSNSVENEYICLKLLAAFGLRTASVEMSTFGERKALVVERFDRRWTKDGRLIRLPQEDMCQVLSVPPTGKYQNEGGPGIVDIMKRLRGSDEPMQDRLGFFKANILFWLMGATDGHAKNFSIALMPEGRFRLTPFYDVLTVQPTFDQKQIQQKKFRLAMSFGKSNHYRIGDICARHIYETATASGLSKELVQKVFQEIHETAEEAIEKTFKELPEGFPEELMESLCGALNSRLQELL
ncbi:type II toxin-antitoxin system HipA family toxin [uncultured Kiloniella sp.]|uniref:type II toxin-antitoxin system HipA family toxin n=1 Tax=uncultured Kiloniella sp. TaxID=1133091 RepID=UPI00260ED203|nr:type II toxin-antitoxin system HipA family toxin [uncultured Kiloniella sp.]